MAKSDKLVQIEHSESAKPITEPPRSPIVKLLEAAADAEMARTASEPKPME